MKKSLKLAVLTAIAAIGSLAGSSCATPFPLGCVYTDITMPVTVGNGDISLNRKGTASCFSILGWVAGGDASINLAAKNGQIDHISWVNMKITNYCGIYGVYTTEVLGKGSKSGPDMSLAPRSSDK